jgi:hypothetical protein
MQFGGAFSYQTEPDLWSEPLNLVKKKSKPVAVVAPSSIVEKCSPEKEICKADSTEPLIKESDGISRVNFDNSSKLDSSSHLKGSDGARPTGMLEALLTRKDPKQFQRNAELTPNNYCTEKRGNEDEKISGADQKNGHKDSKRASVVELTGSYPSTLSGFDPLRPDGLYSMIHSLAACEHKFLTALYMNSLMTAAVATPPGVMPPPALGLGFPPGPRCFLGHENSTFAEACGGSSLIASNAPIMNNLLSFADTQHRLWQMVNWQQERPGVSTAIDTSNATVTSTMDPERKDAVTPQQTVSSIVIPVPPLMSSVPAVDGSMLSRKSKPHSKR